MADSCPNAANHTKAPMGYLQWHKWAREMMKTHQQIICDGCRRYAIWVPKEQSDMKKDGSIAGG